eukprot:g1845.t1
MHPGFGVYAPPALTPTVVNTQAVMHMVMGGLQSPMPVQYAQQSYMANAAMNMAMQATRSAAMGAAEAVPAPASRQRHKVCGGAVDLDLLRGGREHRTSLMIRNVPNRLTRSMLVSRLDAKFKGKYDFLYLPIDFSNRCNMGYAFINIIDHADVEPFCREFDGFKWKFMSSGKVCRIAYAVVQGKAAMVAKFRNSGVMKKEKSFRPLVYFSSGPNKGKQEPFPRPEPDSPPRAVPTTEEAAAAHHTT